MTTRGLHSLSILLILAILCMAAPCGADVWFGDPVVTQTPYDFTDLQVGDLDGDGHAEMVANDLALNELVVYNSGPDGRMTEVQSIRHNDPLYGGRHWFLLIDADHDPYPDLLVNCTG